MAFDKPQSRNEAILQNMLGANNELEPPKSRVEALLQELSGKMPEANPSEGTTTGTLERLKIGDDIYTVEGGGSGTSDYDALNNKPQIASVTLSGDKSLADLGIASATTVSGILDGTDIDSFGDVETALAGKQGTLTAGDYISLNNGNIAVNRNIVRDNYAYNIKFSGDNDLTVTKSQGGTVISTTQYTYEYGSGGGVTYTIDDAFTLETLYHGGQYFKYTALRDSTTHSAGYTWEVDARDTSTDVTEYFSSEDLSGYKLVIKSEMDTALSGKQDTLTFDDTPTDNSNNPVKSNGIYDALALKQDATDDSLETTDKTIVGAINEHEGDVSTLKSGLTNLDNEVNGDATVYPYADVITIEDAVPSNLADCNVKIEPVQDLHGYANPWVGGAEKNKCSELEDGGFDSDGLNSANTKRVRNKYYIPVIAGSKYVVTLLATVSGKTPQYAASFYSVDDYTTPRIITTDWLSNGAAFEVPNNASYIRLLLKYADESDITVSSFENVQIEVGNVATDYVPYENICPISGHTEASVQRDGVNHFQSGSSETVSGILYTKNADGSFTVSGTRDGALSKSLGYAKVKSSFGIVNVSALGTSQNIILYKIILTDSNGTEIAEFNSFGNIDLRNYPTVDKIYISVKGVSNGAVASGTLYPMVVMGEETIPFVPYAGKTYTIALGDTIYGGTVDFDSGVMTVTHRIVDLGTLTWADGDLHRAPLPYSKAVPNNQAADTLCEWYIITSFNTVYSSHPTNKIAIASDNGIYLYNEDMTGSELKTYLDGCHLTYELNYYITVNLTPQQIQLLKGTNTITASTGQISVTVNGVSGAIGSLQTQASDTDAALAELVADIAEQLPTAPTTDGAYVLTVTVADGTPTYSWESAT